MKHCDRHEEQLSAWLDDELERAEQLELVDHLVRCPDCRRYYAEARALEGLVAVVRTPEKVAAPRRELWERIEKQAAPQRRIIPAWALQAAAVLVLAVGTGSLFWFGSSRVAELPTDAIVQLGEQSGLMTDDRFVELTQEILRADTRYRAAMYRVMEQVIRDTDEQEEFADYDVDSGSGGETASNDITGRPPV